MNRTLFSQLLCLGIFTLCLGFSSPKAWAMSLEQQTIIYDTYSLENQKEYSKAIEKMIVLFHESSNDYFINLRLGWLFYLNKQYANAILHYNRAALLAPNSIEPLLALSLIHNLVEDYASTIKICNKILAADPKNLQALQRLISAEIRTQNDSDAEKNVAYGVDLYPTDPIFLEQKAFIKNKLGKKEEAKKALTLLLVVNPSNEYARSQLHVKD